MTIAELHLFIGKDTFLTTVRRDRQYAAHHVLELAAVSARVHHDAERAGNPAREFKAGQPIPLQNLGQCRQTDAAFDTDHIRTLTFLHAHARKRLLRFLHDSRKILHFDDHTVVAAVAKQHIAAVADHQVRQPRVAEHAQRGLEFKIGSHMHHGGGMPARPKRGVIRHRHIVCDLKRGQISDLRIFRISGIILAAQLLYRALQLGEQPQIVLFQKLPPYQCDIC